MKKIILILSFCFCSLNLFAGEFRFITFADYFGRIEAGEDYESLRNRYYVQPKFNFFLGPVDGTVNAEYWYQPIGDETFTSPENILQECYIMFPAGMFDITLGQKKETFGFADVFSPLNVINGGYQVLYSLDDPYEGKRPDLMLQLQFYPNFDDTIELIYVPFPRPNYENRGDVDITGKKTDLTIDFDSLAYNYENPNSVFARYYHLSSAFDLQFVYAWYTDQTPGFDFDDSSISDDTLTGDLETVYGKNQLFGAGISARVKDMVISEDMAFTLTEDLDGKDIGVKNSSFTANTQFTGNIFNGVFAQMNVVYQYFLNFDASSQNDDSSYDVIIKELNDYHIQPQEHIAFAVFVFRKSYLRDKLALALNTAYLHPNVYIAPRANYSFSDRLKLETGVDYNTGKPSDADLVKGYDYDNFFIRMKYEY